eukprot:15231393-Alexandrium_andersonii.AAC.1
MSGLVLLLAYGLLASRVAKLLMLMPGTTTRVRPAPPVEQRSDSAAPCARAVEHLLAVPASQPQA